MWCLCSSSGLGLFVLFADVCPVLRAVPGTQWRFDDPLPPQPVVSLPSGPCVGPPAVSSAVTPVHSAPLLTPACTVTVLPSALASASSLSYQILPIQLYLGPVFPVMISTTPLSLGFPSLTVLPSGSITGSMFNSFSVPWEMVFVLKEGGPAWAAWNLCGTCGPLRTGQSTGAHWMSMGAPCWLTVPSPLHCSDTCFPSNTTSVWSWLQVRLKRGCHSFPHSPLAASHLSG